MVVQTKLKIICLAAIILFNSGAIEYIGEIHEKSAEFTGGEGVPPKAGEPSVQL